MFGNNYFGCGFNEENIMRSLFLLSALALTAACGGSSNDAVVDNQPALDALYENYEALITDESETLAPDRLTGEATYEGTAIIGVAVGDRDSDAPTDAIGAMGEMSVTVNFADESLSGKADNFIEVANAVDFFAEDDDFPSITAGQKLTGELTITGDKAGVSDYDFTVNGEITGTDFEITFVDLGGKATISGTEQDNIYLDAQDSATFNDEEGIIVFAGIGEQ